MTAPDPTSADYAPVTFFENACAVFEGVYVRAAHCTDKLFRVGRHTIRVRIAGNGIAEKMMRALEHLSVPTQAPPDLTVLMWDDVSTRTRMPPAPWNWNYAGMRRGEIRGFNTERMYTTYSMGAGVLQVFDRDTNTALYWTRDAFDLPGYEVAAPMRTILHWFMLTNGLQVVHGGAVGTALGGVLLAGKGGSGKSTSVLACLDSELRYAADDYCLAAPEPQPFVYSLYSSAKLTAESLGRLPHLVPAVAFTDPSSSDKAVLFLSEHWREKLITGFPLVAILLPRVRADQTATVITQADPGEGMRALGLSTLIQLARADAASAQLILGLVTTVPCYWLDVGTDLRQIPRRISELIAQRLDEMQASSVI